MAYNYAAIRAENQTKYGTDIGRIGPLLLANRYDDRTHFIFELLQNAEDALERRPGWNGRRSVEFALSGQALRVSHFGTPFTEGDVRGICGIGESTKDLTAIGRFGIGFKSVYAFTDCPEIHSGDEHFAIESFVWPKAVSAIETEPGQTVLRLPLREDDQSALAEIASGLQRLGPRTLLFLREIEEISWSAAGGLSGLYLRGKPESLGKNARKVVVIGEDRATDGVTEETWLVFSREVSALEGVNVGYAELAFLLEEGESDGRTAVRAVNDPPLVVFFPTILPTNLGFLVQGPYRTTPSRDNVPLHDPWNKYLVKETATLLVEALEELRSLGLLSVDALRSLPLDASRFPESGMFGPLFTAVRQALSTQPLLPRFRGGHIAAQQAKLARTQELRKLFSSPQLTALFQAERQLAWLSEEITQDRTPELRRYLIDELDIAEVVPEVLPSRLTKSFLEAQTDEWTVRLYEFLHGQPALLRAGRLNDVPLIRLEDGNHVMPRKGGQPQAFLPGPVSTGFPTVRRSACQSEEALAFLKSLGLSEPDPVDDVIAHILPKYQRDDVEVGEAQYESDIERLLAAFSTDSTTQRNKLVNALRTAHFVAAVDTGGNDRYFVRPTNAYQATQRLKNLFRGVHGVLIVDDSRDCLRRERIRDLLEACGAALYLQPIAVRGSFSWQELADMRTRAGAADSSRGETIDDFTLRGLDGLLDTFPLLESERLKQRAEILWDALCDVEDRRGTRAFSGTYHWFYHYDRSCTFEAAFVRCLNDQAWVPGRFGGPQPPGSIVFNDTGWKENPFLLSKIRFKPPIIEELAKEAGIEPGVLDFLKKYGLTSEAELRERLGITEEVSQNEEEPAAGTPEEEVRKLPGGPSESPPAVPSTTEGPAGRGAHGNGGQALSDRQHQDSQHQGGARKFVSYVSVEADEEETDPNGLKHQARLRLEEQAITLILLHEPELQRTPTNNPGFDLTQPGTDANPVKWVEVKAMKGTLQDRPVGLTTRQFECAQEHREAYWLYVVEYAGSPEQARIARIQDPAGKARTFTFDHGWLTVAEIDESTTDEPLSPD